MGRQELLPGHPAGRPSPRPQPWRLDVAATGAAESWKQPAERLVAVLRLISEAVAEAYQDGVTWRGLGVGPLDWDDVDRVRKIVADSRAPDGAGACGLLHGYLGESRRPAIIDLIWRAAWRGRVLDVTAQFLPGGGVRSFARHDPEWLASLLGSAVNAVRGDLGRIASASWLEEDARRTAASLPWQKAVPFWLGEVSYLPGRVDPSRLPNSLVVHPWPSEQDAAVVMLADLTATQTAPREAVDDMLALRDRLAM